MPKRKLSPVIYKKSKHFKKFIQKTKQKLLKPTIATNTKTIGTNRSNKISLTTLVTNDECNIDEELQMYDNGCDYFKLMNTKEATMSTTCDDKDDEVDNDVVRDDDDDDNKQSVASSCYASISTDNGSDKLVVKNEDSDCCDDTNNHSNNNNRNNKKTKVINDNNTNVASNVNEQSNKQILNNDSKEKITATAVGAATAITRLITQTNKNHHKLSNKTNDTDEDHVVDTKDDDEKDYNVEDNNDVVDNCNVDNVKYNQHHKISNTQQEQLTTSAIYTTTIEQTSYMPLKIKQEYLDSFPGLSSSLVNTSSTSSSSFSLSSFENSQHHKIKNCEIHQQPQSSSYGHIQNSIVQQLGTFVSNYGMGRVNYGQNSTGCRREPTTSLSKW